MSSENQGYIKFISTLKPANNEIPLIEAEDVYVYKQNQDGEIEKHSLDKYLDGLGISDLEKDKIIKSAVDQAVDKVTPNFSDLRTDVNENIESIGNLESNIGEINKTLSELSGDNENLGIEISTPFLVSDANFDSFIIFSNSSIVNFSIYIKIPNTKF